MQAVFHLEELLNLALHQSADGNARPLADDAGDVLFIHFLFEHALGLLQLLKARFVLLDVGFELRHLAVLQLRRLGVVAAALHPFDLAAHLLELFLQRAAGLDRILLLLPVRAQLRRFFLEVGELLIELGEAILRGLVGFLAQRLALDFELHHAALHFIELDRQRIDLHAQLRRGFINQIDRLVRQEPVGDVAVGEHGGGDQRGVLELHAVVDLVALAQAAQDADGVFDGRLADIHRLKPPLERRVLFDVLLILVERGRANGVQLAARQHRLQHVRRVHRAFGRAGADHGVELVDEQDDLAFRVGHFLQDGLQAIFELAAVLRAGDQRAHVERHDPLVLQPFRHVAANDALRQALDDRRLADAWLTDQHGVVLGAARQHLDDATDFLVAADHRIELALARQLGEIASVLFERFVFAFGVLIGDALAAAHRRERFEDFLARDAARLQQVHRGGAPRLAEHAHQQVLGADELVLHRFRIRLRGVEHDAQARGEVRLGAAVRLGLP